MEQTTATRRRPATARDADTRCPNCGEPAKRDQLVCLRCGGRIGLDYRRPPGWKLPTAIVAGVALVALVGFGFGLREITRNARSEVADAGPAGAKPPRAPAKKPAARKPAAPEKSTAPAKKPAKKPTKKPAKKPAVPAGLPKRAGTWPVAKDGFTVILVSVDNPVSAKATASQAKQSGVPAGYLRSNDFSSLQKGNWYVYGGVYPTRGQAEKAAAKFGSGYPGAYVQFVRGSKPANFKGKKG